MRQEIRREVPAADVKRTVQDFKDSRHCSSVDVNPPLKDGEPEAGKTYTVTATFTN